MRWSIVDDQNQVINVIVYDGVSEITLPENTTLVETNDWVEIGDQVSKEMPEVAPPPSEEQLKEDRNQAALSNLSLIGCFRIEQKSNESLTFSDYLDQLEEFIPD